MTPRFIDAARGDVECLRIARDRQRRPEGVGTGEVVPRAHARHAERQVGARLHGAIATLAGALDELAAASATASSERDASSVIARRCIASTGQRLVAARFGDRQRPSAMRIASSMSPARASVCTSSERVCTMSADCPTRSAIVEQLAALGLGLACALAESYARLQAAQLDRQRLRRARWRSWATARIASHERSTSAQRPECSAARASSSCTAARSSSVVACVQRVLQELRRLVQRVQRHGARWRRGGTTDRPWPRSSCSRSATRCGRPHPACAPRGCPRSARASAARRAGLTDLSTASTSSACANW